MLNLSDEKLARLLDLCSEIANIRREIPAPPPNFDLSHVRLETARALRDSLAQHEAALTELSVLLNVEGEPKA